MIKLTWCLLLALIQPHAVFNCCKRSTAKEIDWEKHEAFMQIYFQSPIYALKKLDLTEEAKRSEILKQYHASPLFQLLAGGYSYMQENKEQYYKISFAIARLLPASDSPNSAYSASSPTFLPHEIELSLFCQIPTEGFSATSLNNWENVLRSISPTRTKEEYTGRKYISKKTTQTQSTSPAQTQSD